MQRVAPFLAGLLPAALAAQQPAPRSLGRVEVELAEPFTEVRGVRELGDGRLVVLDGREQQILLVDLRAQTRTHIGRIGDGPGEYRLPLRLYPLPGDTTAVYDMPRPQGLLLIGPDGRPAGLRSTSGDPPGSRPLIQPHAVDRLGRYYIRDRDPFATGPTPDSAPLVRIDPRTGTRTVVGRMVDRVWMDHFRERPTRPGPLPPFATVAQWAVDTDGRVAVVSVQPYRITFFLPDGRRVDGPAIPWERIALSTEHRSDYMERYRRPLPMIMMGPGGQQTAGYMPNRRPDPTLWPDYLPPFLPDAATFAPDGRLWIRRTTTADAPPTYDLIDETGQIASRLILPPRTRLVGFGARSVYLVQLDDDDLEYLQRYSLPGR